MEQFSSWNNLQLDERLERDKNLRLHGSKSASKKATSNTENARRRDVCAGKKAPLDDLKEEDVKVRVQCVCNVSVGVSETVCVCALLLLPVSVCLTFCLSLCVRVCLHVLIYTMFFLAHIIYVALACSASRHALNCFALMRSTVLPNLCPPPSPCLT